METHHWEGIVANPDMYYGFLYIITNNISGKKYIGRKFYHKYVKRKQAGASNWKKYTGSCKPLNEDIKELGKENFSFVIISQYKRRGNVVYYECNYQHKYDVLTSRDVEGNRLWYNGNIGGIKFIPPTEHTEETRAKLSKSHTGKKLTAEHKEKIGKAGIGRTTTEATKEKIRQSKVGIPRDEATKEKIGKAFRGARYAASLVGEKRYIGRACKICQAKLKYTCNATCVACDKRKKEERKKS